MIKKIRLDILLIIIFSVLFVFLLFYNSYFKLSYVRKTIGQYTIVVPKDMEYEDRIDYSKIYGKNIDEAVLNIYIGTYEMAKKRMGFYSFYPSKSKIEYEDEKIDDNRLYTVIKKVTYYDNEESTYMLNILYEISYDTMFIVSVESSDINYLMKLSKKLEKTAKSATLY